LSEAEARDTGRVLFTLNPSLEPVILQRALRFPFIKKEIKHRQQRKGTKSTDAAAVAVAAAETPYAADLPPR
jgi:hypothetical protein